MITDAVWVSVARAAVDDCLLVSWCAVVTNVDRLDVSDLFQPMVPGRACSLLRRHCGDRCGAIDGYTKMYAFSPLLQVRRIADKLDYVTSCLLLLFGPATLAEVDEIEDILGAGGGGSARVGSCAMGSAYGGCLV